MSNELKEYVKPRLEDDDPERCPTDNEAHDILTAFQINIAIGEKRQQIIGVENLKQAKDYVRRARELLELGDAMKHVRIITDDRIWFKGGGELHLVVSDSMEDLINKYQQKVK